SALEYMLYHQKSFAQVKPGISRRKPSQIFAPVTSLFDCFQNWTSDNVRSYQPLPTMPCCEGVRPVRYVDCAVQVTAGNAGATAALAPFAANVRMCEDASSTDCVSPTTLMTARRFIGCDAKAFQSPREPSLRPFHAPQILGRW